MADPNDIPLRINWLVNGRRAHGYLVIEDDALHLICLRDESETAANVGNATAKQFGLIGGLLSAGVSLAREAGRAKELQALYAAHRDLPPASRVQQNPLSRTVARSELTGIQKGPHLVPTLQSTSGPVPIQSESAAVYTALEAWCDQQQIPTAYIQPSKMNRKLLWGLLLSPFALALLYVLICIPFALVHRSNTTAAMVKFEAFRAVAVPAEAAITGPIGKPLVETCGALLQQIPVGQQVAFVGALPPSGAAMLKDSDRDDFPRFTTLEPAYSQWSEPRLRAEALESKWRGKGTFGKSFERMLENPFDWSRVSADTRLPRFEDARLLLVAKVQDVQISGEGLTDRSKVAGRAAMVVRVLDFQTGAVKCEGDLTMAFPPDGEYSADKLSFAMTQGLPLGLHAPGCGTKTDGACRDVVYYARITAPLIAAPAMAAAPKPSPKKPAPKPARRSKR
jgi:hypothetical protein